MGRVKSEKTTGESILRMTTELPSTGDLTIPTIRRFCSHGARDVRRTVANRAAHFAFPCLGFRFKDRSTWVETLMVLDPLVSHPWKQEAVVMIHRSLMRMPSQTCCPFL